MSNEIILEDDMMKKLETHGVDIIDRKHFVTFVICMGYEVYTLEGDGELNESFVFVK